MIIETDRLLLRPFEAEDAKEAYRQSREAQMRRFLPDQVYYSAEEAEETLRSLRRRTVNPLARSYPYVLAIARKDMNHYVGHVGLSEIEFGIEIGFGVGAAYRGRGYAAEAASAFLLAAMPLFDLAEVYGVVDEENIASIRTLERLGFLLIKKGPPRGSARRVYRYSIQKKNRK